MMAICFLPCVIDGQLTPPVAWGEQDHSPRMVQMKNIVMNIAGATQVWFALLVLAALPLLLGPLIGHTTQAFMRVLQSTIIILWLAGVAGGLAVGLDTVLRSFTSITLLPAAIVPSIRAMPCLAFAAIALCVFAMVKLGKQ